MMCILYTNIRTFNFHGSPDLRKDFNNEQFPNYGNAFIGVLAEATVALIVYAVLPCEPFALSQASFSIIIYSLHNSLIGYISAKLIKTFHFNAYRSHFFEYLC